jgi:hypothetical protein
MTGNSNSVAGNSFEIACELAFQLPMAESVQRKFTSLGK